MRIESKGIVIREIFKQDEGEQIEIDPDGQSVKLILIAENGSQAVINCSTEAFRQLVSAINRADMEIREIEHPTAAA